MVWRMTAIRRFFQAVLICVLHLSSAWAGGGPETMLLVVNAASPISLTVANAYVQMRDIPQSHIVWLDDVPAADSIDIDTFRNRIWKPISDYIASNHLEKDIDAIIYSADFPYRVDFKSDLKSNKVTNSRYRGNFASLTGLTYFAHRVERGDISYVGENYYFRHDLAPYAKPSHPISAVEVKAMDDATKELDHKDYNRAVEVLQPLVNDHPRNVKAWYLLSRGQAALGHNDKAMQALSKAVDLGWSHSLTIRNDNLFKPLQTYPGFTELIHKMQHIVGPFQSTHGFRSQYIWTGGELPVYDPKVTDSLDQYYLSTMLAYTGLQGNSVPEVLKYLKEAVSSDGSFPHGTVYLMENSDIRTETRENSFHATVEALTKRGHRVAILVSGQDGQNGILPRNKQDVIGAVVGYRRYDWARSHSRLLPGAIAESLTSFGGDFDRFAQTKLTEFLRYGAAGSSGAVAEPYSIQAKFPSPSLHIHYADGSSLAEAFYQSIEAPYQLIIVGDPLARPFAHFADVSLRSPRTTQPWHDSVLIEPAVKRAKGHAINHMELWIDGHFRDRVAPWDVFLWDTKTVEDGCHDVRLVAVEDSAIETRSYVRLPVRVNNYNHRVGIKTSGNPIGFGDDIKLSGSAPQAQRVQVYQGTRLLDTAQVKDGRWTTRIASRILGLGKAQLYARAFYHDGSTARSCGTLVSIDPPAPLPGKKTTDDNKQEGLRVLMHDVDNKDHKLVIKKLNGKFKELKGAENTVASMHLDGEFKVEKPGFYQLTFATRGHLRVKIDNRRVTDTEISNKYGGVFLPLDLDSGWHVLDIDYVPAGTPFIKARLAGERPPVMLGDKILRHTVERTVDSK